MPGDQRAVLGKLATLLDQHGIAVEDIGKVRRVNLWQGFHKDEDGDAQVIDLAAISLTPSWDEGPEWPVVQPAAPRRPRPPGKRPPKTLVRTAVVLPDPQIGFRALDDGLDPFHDEDAMAVALAVTKALRPTDVINLGDFVDLPAHGKYRQEPAWASTTQAALDRAHEFLAQQREAAPHARIVLLEGNHDRRLQNHILDNAAASFGLRQAHRPTSWPVLSLPNLLRLDELGVEYVGGYPAGRFWLLPDLSFVHGVNINPNKTLGEERVSVVHGHLHRVLRQHRTFTDHEGARRIMVASPGCLCRVDGAVPSTKGSTDPYGAPIAVAENWQQGMAVVTYDETGAWSYEDVLIEGNRALFRGQLYTA